MIKNNVKGDQFMDGIKSILDFFRVSSQSELIKFIEENPHNEQVIELKELLLLMDVRLDGEKNE